MAEITLTKSNFKEEVLDAKGTVLVDFWASWCVPCKMLAPVLHDVAEEYEGQVKVCKVNVDEEMELAQEYKISSIPTVFVFQDGVLQKQSVGFLSKEDIVNLWK